LIRRGSQLIAAARVMVGVVALARPGLPARPWVGARSDDLTARVFGRALGARDLALGLGALNALRGTDESAAAWVAAGALSDALDVAASAASWQELPRSGRWLVVASAGGAAVAGAVGAAALALGAGNQGEGKQGAGNQGEGKRADAGKQGEGKRADAGKPGEEKQVGGGEHERDKQAGAGTG
jgi:hypothetical protein